MHTKQGSVFFIVLIFFIAISALIYSSLRTNSYFVLLAREREQYEIHYQLARSLQIFALEYYADQIKSADKITSKVTLLKVPWPHASSCYEGHVWLQKEKVAKSMTVMLYTDIRRNKKVVFSLKV